MPPMPVEAEAPPDLLTPATAMAAASASRARASSTPTSVMSGSSRSSAGTSRAKSAGSARPRSGRRRGARHGDGALGKAGKAAAVEIVGRDHRLLAADEDAKPKIVAFGALRFLHGAVAHLDRQRHAAHGDGVGLVGAGALGGGDETFGDVGECGLVEERWHWLVIGLCGVANNNKRRCGRRARVSSRPVIARSESDEAIQKRRRSIGLLRLRSQ